jgi:hypothetical protein
MVDSMGWPRAQLVGIGDRAVCARVMGRGPMVVLEAGGAGEGTTGTFSGTVEEQLAEFGPRFVGCIGRSGLCRSKKLLRVLGLPRPPRYERLAMSTRIGSGWTAPSVDGGLADHDAELTCGHGEGFDAVGARRASLSV